MITFICLVLLLVPVPLLRYLDGEWRDSGDYMVIYAVWAPFVAILAQILQKL